MVRAARSMVAVVVHGSTGAEHERGREVHVKSAARVLPKVSAAPVVMVAVKTVFRARLTRGRKGGDIGRRNVGDCPGHARPAWPGQSKRRTVDGRGVHRLAESYADNGAIWANANVGVWRSFKDRCRRGLRGRRDPPHSDYFLDCSIQRRNRVAGVLPTRPYSCCMSAFRASSSRLKLAPYVVPDPDPRNSGLRCMFTIAHLPKRDNCSRSTTEIAG